MKSIETSWFRSGPCRVLAGGLVALTVVATTFAQTPSNDAALKDRVLQLVERLDSPKEEARNSAQASLIKLGPKIIPFLPELKKDAKPETIRRLTEIRSALAKQDEVSSAKASRVTIEGEGIRLSEAIQQLQKQSGNMITDLRDPDGASTSNPKLSLKLRDVPFFEALDIITRKAGVSATFATGDGSVGLIEGPSADKSASQLSGPFRISLRQIGLVRDFQTGSASATVQLDVAWEPRIRPMLLSLKADELEVVDNQGRPVSPQVDKESTEVVLRPENPIAEINLNLMAPDRSAKALSKLKLRADVTIPSGLKTFRFAKLNEENITQKIGDVSVKLKGTEIEESVWKVNLELHYPGEGPAFESYRQGLFNNRIWLQKADGSKFEQNGGFSNTNAEGGRLGFEYLFVDVPGKPADYQLVYETPSEVRTIPIDVIFTDVALP